MGDGCNVSNGSPVDETFEPNTLCLDSIWATHPFLYGTDGIALDEDENIWNSVNERNAIVIVTEKRKVIEFFRNDPDGTTMLRNDGDMESPTSPFLSGTTFCTTHSDGSRGDNNPPDPGDVLGGGSKVNCLNEELESEGLPLPVSGDD